ncbi:response regulator [Parasediminibacterium sp. JCM 36343]|uniref:response regulator n=1 Tax=Parasediminibacterium sp. JCM 36343 TaxID=3374279 RepID=UPI00397D83C7
MNILIGDDHAIVRKGLKMILTEAYPHAYIEEAIDGADLVKRLHNKPWSVIISDISMPGRSGLEIIKVVKEYYPKIPILILSLHSPEHYAVRTFKAGASGYITKESAPEELVKAIEQVLGGRKYVSPEIGEMLLHAQLDEYNEELHQSLSDREMEVFRQIALGKKITDIAEELSLSVNTISTYRTRILEKMHLSSNAEIARYALQHGIL